MLAALNPNEVFIRPPRIPGAPYEFYQNMIPDSGVTHCKHCYQFFYKEDFEFAVLQKGCPFCWADTETAGL